MDIVINACYGGFGLNKKAVMRYAELKRIELYPYISKTIYDTHKKVYGRTPTVDSPDVMFVSYSTKPVEDGGEAVDDNYFNEGDIPRDDLDLVKVVREMGDKVNTGCSKLKVVEISDDVEWEIKEYDGKEWIAEKHRTWR